MILDLIDPIPSNFMSDFPGQNTVNLNAIDEYAGPCLTTHPLQTYTPSLTAVTTSPTLGGSGFNRGFFYTIFDQVFVFGEYRVASGFTTGSGVYSISLPFAAKTVVGVNTNIGSAPVIGNGLLFDASADATRQPLTVHLKTSTTISFGIRMGSGGAVREVNEAAPVSWADGDGITWCARYQRVA